MSKIVFIDDLDNTLVLDGVYEERLLSEELDTRLELQDVFMPCHSCSSVVLLGETLIDRGGQYCKPCWATFGDFGCTECGERNSKADAYRSGIELRCYKCRSDNVRAFVG